MKISSTFLFFCRDWEVDLKIYIKYSLYSYKEYIKTSCNSTMKRQIIQFYNGQSFWTDISLLNLFCVGFWLCCAAWRILVPWQGSNPCPLQWMCKALTTGPSGKSLSRHLSKDNIQIAIEHMKRCSTSLVIRKIKTKSMMRYYFTH